MSAAATAPATATAPAAARPARRRWLRRTVWLAVLAAVALLTISLLLQIGVGKAALTRRLSRSFGRPVEVGKFNLSLWGGLRLEANQVTVGEDPRFGHEHFLRAERLTAGIRLTALLAGRVELDSLVLTRPSLNLVRTSDGQWNLESWLPWPAGSATGAPAPPDSFSSSSAVRLRRMRVEGGRINFKLGVEKHPFALAGVEGTVEQAGSGQWSVDVEGRPMRAGVVVQEAGTIRVRGTLGGTSARLRPANLAVSWDAASLSDALRLAVGFDHGVRGDVTFEGRVSSPSPGAGAGGAELAGSRWSLSGALRLRGVHRWDLPSRDNDPAVNVGFDAHWWPLLARVDFTRATIEGPGTVVRGAGFAQWGTPPAHYRASEPKVSPHADSNFHFVSSGISLNDLFRWYPAFRGEAEAGLSLGGYAGLDMQVGGWPPRIERLVMATGGAQLRASGSSQSTRLAAAALRYEHKRGRVELGPTTILFGQAGGRPATSLRLEATATPGTPWRIETSVMGQAADARTLLETASRLGISPAHAWTSAGWSVEGQADLRLGWQGTLFPFSVRPQGTIRLRNARLSSASLQAPVEIASAAIELAASETRVTLENARALGAMWSGALHARGPEPWDFTLSAEGLDAADAQGWLTPVNQRTGLLQRFASGRSSPPLAEALRDVRARGRVTVRRLRFLSLLLGPFESNVAMDLAAPWRLELSHAQAGFFGGTLAGSFRAQGPEGSDAAGPSYEAEVQLRGVNVATLTAGMPRIRNLFGGMATGELKLAARGADREALLDSLTGSGSWEVLGAQTTLLDLAASLRAEQIRAGSTAVARSAARFSFAQRKLTFDDLQLFSRSARPSSPDGQVTGTVDLSGEKIALDLRLLLAGEAGAPPVPRAKVAPEPEDALARREFRITGPLNPIEVKVTRTSPRP